MTETKDTRVAEYTRSYTAKVAVPIDDNNVDGRRRCDRGEHSFEEFRRGVLGGVNRFHCNLECSEAFVSRQIEMLE